MLVLIGILLIIGGFMVLKNNALLGAAMIIIGCGIMSATAAIY